jgi:threonylcarbamoyladenosine tRNA methylthiotransferase MtaB
VPHFHLSLQSGCDDTLRRRRRKYDTARFFESVTLLRSAFPGCGLTADLITGFPGEDEREFAETLAFVEKCAFSSMHVFPFSRRPGTPAASMPGQVKNAVKRERAARASALADRMAADFRQSLIGTVQHVLFENGEGWPVSAIPAATCWSRGGHGAQKQGLTCNKLRGKRRDTLW